MLRGFGFTPRWVGEDAEDFQMALDEDLESAFYVMKTEKGEGGPNRHQDAHQIPLKNPKTDAEELKLLEEWLRSYRPEELFEELFGGTKNDR